MNETEKQDQTKPLNLRRRRILMVILAIAVILTIGTLAIAAPMVLQGAEHGALIKIPKNATKENIRDSLTLHLGKEYSDRVTKLLKVRDVDWTLRHGQYLIEQGETPYEAMRKLARGAQHPVRLTVNAARGEEVLAQKIAEKMDFSAADFLTAIHDPALAEQYGVKPSQILAIFLNDTYEVYWSSSPKSVIDKIGKNYKKYWTKERIAKADSLGLSPADAVIIASIVCEETNIMDEKGRIGRLYVNRLNKGMKLQADPTVRFAIGDYTIKRVTRDHLKYESPYNTYLHQGLPPGPIRTVNKSTLEALLNSEPTEELYMCAKEDFSGRHNFAVTYEEHLQNAKRYQEELDRRGIK